jgi:hypothetical protein
LKQKKEEIIVDQLGQHFHIEEELKIKDNEEQGIMSSKVHMVEEEKEGTSSKKPSQFKKPNKKKRKNFKNQKLD